MENVVCRLKCRSGIHFETMIAPGKEENMGCEFRVPGTVTLIPRASEPMSNFGELSADEINKMTTELTDEEKSSPYADLYYQESPMTEEQNKIWKGEPMDPADALEPEDYAKMMNNTGHCKVETGFCELPGRIGYSAVLIKQPGRTNEKMDAFNKEFGVEGALMYKAWCPGYHYYQYRNGAIEDFGYGLLSMLNVDSTPTFAAGLDIGLFGIDMDKVLENDPDCLWISGNYWRHYPVLKDRISDEYTDDIIINYLRKTDYGRELRIRKYTGLGVYDGKLVRTGTPKELPPAEYGRHAMHHLMLEYGNEARLVNQFWERRGKHKADIK